MIKFLYGLIGIVAILAATENIAYGYSEKDTVTILLKDTIHLSGYIQYPDGKPAKYVAIESKKHPGFINTMTDSTGFFRLVPALFEDTYILNRYTGYQYTFQNKGSRHIKLIIPEFTMTFKDSTTVKRINSKPEKNTEITKVFDKIQAFISYEAFAEFPGGYRTFSKYLSETIKYPVAALQSNIEGEVSVLITIGRSGRKGGISDVKILKGIGYGCDEEVVNALKNSPKWNSPRVRYGQSIEQKMQIDYLFKIED